MDMLMYALIVLMLFIVIWLDNRQHKQVGNIGEKIVADKLSELPEEFVVMNNVRYKNVQIDHMVINHAEKIIFVIETKMWGGKITGKSDDRMWRQDKDGQVKYFNNPILQNKYHCSVVRKKYVGYSVRSIVVFVNNSNVPRYRCVMSSGMLVDHIIGVSNKVSNRGRIDVETDWMSKRVKAK